MRVRILVVDDHPVVRAGLRYSLADHGIDVVGEADSGEGLLKMLDGLKFDVVLLDVRLPSLNGLDALARLKDSHPRIPVVMMTGYDNPSFVFRAIHLGAAGYVTKDAPLVRHAEVVHAAARGENTFTREDLRRVTGALATPRLGPEHDIPLTLRECEVLRLLGDGMTNKQIADRMRLSYETVKEHVQHILQKIGVVDRTQAVYWGLRCGVIKLDGKHSAP
jgi:DNA-binding NarL/FixJ family response regulator